MVTVGLVVLVTGYLVIVHSDDYVLRFSEHEQEVAELQQEQNPEKPLFDYDNETSARSLRTVDQTRQTELYFRVSPDSWQKSPHLRTRTFEEYWEICGLGSDQVLLRYNLGRYYSVVKTDEGKYIFALFEPISLEFDPANVAENYKVQQTDACYISKLQDADQFAGMKLGTSLEKVAWDSEAFWPIPMNPDLRTSVHYLDNLAVLNLCFEDGTLTRHTVKVAKHSVLSFLLPQDLALIS